MVEAMLEYNLWWFAYDVIKIMIMQITIDLSQILI